jgi:hypothetical protein
MRYHCLHRNKNSNRLTERGSKKPKIVVIAWGVRLHLRLLSATCVFSLWFVWNYKEALVWLGIPSLIYIEAIIVTLIVYF